MNLEAVKWLEELADEERAKMFNPVYPWDGQLFQFKKDHELAGRNGFCGMCSVTAGANLLVIE